MGAGEIKHRTALTSRNVMQKAMVYWQYTLKRTNNPEEFNLANVLLQMVSSGKYYPSASFVCAQSGEKFFYSK